MSNYVAGEIPPDRVVKKILERPWLYGLCRIPERKDLEVAIMGRTAITAAGAVLELLRTNNKEE